MAIKDYWKPILGAAIVAIIAVVVVVVVMNNKSEGTTKAPVVGTTAPVLVTDVVTENPDPCKDYKCQNGGTCMKYEHCGEPECTCPSGFIGDKCETTDVCHDFCTNGVCEVDGDKAKCDCPKGYTGDKCETKGTKGEVTSDTITNVTLGLNKTCGMDQFPCSDKKKCLNIKVYGKAPMCDGVEDCEDGSDEDDGHCDREFPTFTDWTGKDPCKSSTKCFKVTFPNDQGEDYALLTQPEESNPRLFKGTFKDEGEPIVFILPDAKECPPEETATAQFHSMHVGTCVDFAVNLETEKSECIQDDLSVINDADDGKIPADWSHEGDYTSSIIAMQTSGKGTLERSGYRLKLKVYYDDKMKAVYGSTSRAEQKIKEILYLLEEKYAEKDTLQTVLAINAKSVPIEYKQGQDWSRAGNNGFDKMAHVGTIARPDDKVANLFVFITGKQSGSGLLGSASCLKRIPAPRYCIGIGSICEKDAAHRVTINRYGAGRSTRNKVLFTSRLVAHEMGHNLGMHHDFDNSNRQPRRGTNGKACYGYMDYKESTNFWSQCSVDDFTGTEKGCLQKLDPDNVQPPITGCEDDKAYRHCTTFKWACTDDRYPWFRQKCKKTCNVGC